MLPDTQGLPKLWLELIFKSEHRAAVPFTFVSGRWAIIIVMVDLQTKCKIFNDLPGDPCSPVPTHPACVGNPFLKSSGRTQFEISLVF